MKKLVALAVFLLLASSAAAIMRINVYVAGAIDGKIPHYELPEAAVGEPVSFLVVWENTGSVGCGFRLRADVYERVGDTLQSAYSSWSAEAPIEPGGVAELEAFWYPEKSGDYTVRTFLYFCNSIDEGPSGNFSVTAANRSRLFVLPAAVRASGNEEYAEFIINPKENLSSVTLVPRDYPMGWVFESARKDGLVAGQDNVVRVGYRAAIWKEANVTFDLVSSDGRYYQPVTVELKKPEPFPVYEAVIVVLVLIILILSIKVIRIRRGGAKDDEGEESSG
jgi:hypothetical protein